MTLKPLKTQRPVADKPDWLYPSWSAHRRFKVGTAEIYVGINNSWRWESWSKDGSVHMKVEGYKTEEEAVAASPCREHHRLAYEELCKISYSASYAWLIIDAATGETWGRTGFETISCAEVNARAWLRSGRPEARA